VIYLVQGALPGDERPKDSGVQALAAASAIEE